MTEGTTLQGASDEDGQRRSRRGTRERSGRRRGWPITCVGWQGDATGTEARRMRGGRGNARSCPDNPPSSLSRRCPDRSRLARSASRPFPRPFDGLRAFLLPPLCPSRSRSRSRARSIEGVRSLPLQRRGDAPWRAPPITAECARSKAPRARVLIRSGVLSIWVIANVNKDNTWRTIMSRNYSRHTDHNCAGFSSAAIMLRRPSPG